MVEILSVETKLVSGYAFRVNATWRHKDQRSLWNSEKLGNDCVTLKQALIFKKEGDGSLPIDAERKGSCGSISRVLIDPTSTTLESFETSEYFEATS